VVPEGEYMYIHVFAGLPHLEEELESDSLLSCPVLRG
jgi:hypothetical protein